MQPLAFGLVEHYEVLKGPPLDLSRSSLCMPSIPSGMSNATLHFGVSKFAEGALDNVYFCGDWLRKISFIVTSCGTGFFHFLFFSQLFFLRRVKVLSTEPYSWDNRNLENGSE